jgi:hypothetical protein
MRTPNRAPGVDKDTPGDDAGGESSFALAFAAVCKAARPAKRRKGRHRRNPLVIPGLTRNPELFSPAQRAAKFE